MKIAVENLKANLRDNVAPIFCISGDELLLVQEACDTIRVAARAHGCTERSIWHVGSGFAWGDWFQHCNTRSLFADRQLVELRLSTSKISDEGAALLSEYCGNPSPDNVLLIVCGKLEAETQRQAWYKIVEERAVVIQIWPLTRAQLPAWASRRLRDVGLQATPGAVALLVERTEGNPLACAQEIDKIALLHPPGAIDEASLLEVVGDSARFDVYGLVDSALDGDARRVARILERLREEGSEPVLILWALSREARGLFPIVQAVAAGGNLNQVLADQRVWDKRKPLIRKAAQRHDHDSVASMLQMALRVDRTIKGEIPGNTWDELLNLALTLAGVRLFGAAVRPGAR